MNKKLFIIALIGLSSCGKFLDKPLQDHPSTSSDPNLATNLVNGAYNDLLSGDTWGSGNDVHGFSFIAATNIISDDADKGSTPQDQPGIGDFDNFTLDANSVFCNSLWQGYYSAIGDVNTALANLPPATSIDSVTKTRYTGEMRVLRGYYYFNLVRMFGDVPKVLRVPTGVTDINSSSDFTTRTAASTIYDSVIIPDLQFGVDHLPGKATASPGRMNKGIAEAELAKAYLYRKNWQKAYDLSTDIVSSGQYQLVSDYSLLWKPAGNNCSESIFEIQSGDFANVNLGIQLYCTCQGPRVGGKGGWTDLGYGFCDPSTSLISAYESGDVRKNATIIFIDQSAAHTGTILWDGFRIPSADSVQNLTYNYKAYNSENKSINTQYSDVNGRDYKQKNVKLIRYGEVILIQAEAANELGNTAVAITDLNMIRNRAGLANTTASGQADLRNAIWKERRVELAMEHDRYWDLVRTSTPANNRVQQAMVANGKTNFTVGKNELLPIPAVQIALSNGKLTQNPGY